MDFLCANDWTNDQIGLLIIVAFVGGMVFSEIVRNF